MKTDTNIDGKKVYSCDELPDLKLVQMDEDSIEVYHDGLHVANHSLKELVLIEEWAEGYFAGVLSRNDF